MSAIQKEQIYAELRKYHLDEFPETLSNLDMDNLLAEYRILEDEVIAMLLGLVNGKSEYVDLTGSLKTFIDKAKPKPKGNKSEISEREHFVLKSEQLRHILGIAERASFTVRPARKVRESTREVITKVNRK